MKKIFFGEKRFKTASVFIYAAIFLLMLILNFLTHYLVDDYTYMNSFATGERISSFWQIFPSLSAHAKIMNGRLIAHFFVQLFLLLPPAVFKIINAAMFALQVFLISNIGGTEKRHGVFFSAIAFGLLWIFEPVFGQVNLWLDGSCNYLWASVICIAFMYPFFNLLLKEKTLDNPALIVLWVILGFIAGAYSENISATVIFMTALVIVFILLFMRKRLKFYYFISFAASICGFLFMLLQPAERSGKITEFSLGTFRINFISALNMLKSYWFIILIFVILSVISYFHKVPREKMVVSWIFAAGAIFSVFILVFAEYLPERCAAFSVVLFAAADITLMRELVETDAKISIYCLAAAISLVAVYYVLIGTNDIYSSYCFSKENIATVERCREENISDVSLPMITPHTKYSAVYGLKYLDCETPNTWPNSSMAAYFKVKSIKGYYP